MNEKVKAIELLIDYKKNKVCTSFADFGKSACSCCGRAVEMIDQALALLKQKGPVKKVSGLLDIPEAAIGETLLADFLGRYAGKRIELTIREVKE
jgi:hypothetical protein